MAKNHERVISSLEVGRGCAAVLVMFYHLSISIFKYYSAQPVGNWIFRSGHIGVDYFFVLSGFIIYYVHSSDIGAFGNISTFALKRLIRIFPMYWIALFLIVVGFSLFPNLGEDRDKSFIRISADIILFPLSGRMTVPPAWTLQHELLFYAFFAILIFRPFVGIVFLILWQFICVWFAYFGLHDGSAITILLFHVNNISFGMGLISAWLVKRRMIPNQQISLLLGIAGVALFTFRLMIDWAYGTPPQDQYGDWNSILGHSGSAFIATAASGLIVYGFAALETAYWIKIPKFLALFGGSSYVLYLFHEPLISVILKILRSGPMKIVGPAEAFWITSLICIGVAIILHLYVEKPLLRSLRHKLLPQPQQPTRHEVVDVPG